VKGTSSTTAAPRVCAALGKFTEFDDQVADRDDRDNDQ
jgi:hypothetical protein